jgi:hypothetical protein
MDGRLPSAVSAPSDWSPLKALSSGHLTLALHRVERPFESWSFSRAANSRPQLGMAFSSVGYCSVRLWSSMARSRKCWVGGVGGVR